MPDDLQSRVIRVITATQHLPEGKVTIDSTFQELGIDSLDGINILFALENEFDINIPNDDAQKILTVREMAEGVQALVSAKDASNAA